jgi:hypothetical protein
MSSSRAEPCELVLGEVRTCLLRTSSQLPAEVAAQVLELLPGGVARIKQRPARSVSGPLPTGVDCKLMVPKDEARGTQPRATHVIGTVQTNAIITGGLVLQASARTKVTRAASANRLSWSHYTARPGVVEAVEPPDPARLAAGFLGSPSPGEYLDLGAVAERLLATVQRDDRLDHTTALRSRTTRVLWAAVPDATLAEPRAQILVVDPAVVRTVLLRMPPGQINLAAEFCEDFALHDWLYSTLDQVIQEAERRRSGGEDPIDLVRAAVERLQHLWLPGTRLAPELAGLWPALERTLSLGQQWKLLVGRIESQIALQTLQALADTRRHSVGW